MSTPELALPPASICERCGTPFHCGMNDTTPCWCTTLPPLPRDQLTRAMAQADGKVWQGCLCPACLQHIVAGPAGG